jgi:hypothetical protein
MSQIMMGCQTEQSTKVIVGEVYCPRLLMALVFQAAADCKLSYSMSGGVRDGCA